MGFITTFSNFANLQTFDNFQRFISAFCTQVTQVINGQIEFGKNIKSSDLKSVTFGQLIPVEIPHDLGFVPSGYIVTYQDAGGWIYQPAGVQYNWTSTSIWLVSSDTLNAKFYII